MDDLVAQVCNCNEACRHKNEGRVGAGTRLFAALPHMHAAVNAEFSSCAT